MEDLESATRRDMLDHFFCRDIMGAGRLCYNITSLRSPKRRWLKSCQKWTCVLSFNFQHKYFDKKKNPIHLLIRYTTHGQSEWIFQQELSKSQTKFQEAQQGEAIMRCTEVLLCSGLSPAYHADLPHGLSEGPEGKDIPWKQSNVSAEAKRHVQDFQEFPRTGLPMKKNIFIPMFWKEEKWVRNSIMGKAHAFHMTDLVSIPGIPYGPREHHREWFLSSPE